MKGKTVQSIEKLDPSMGLYIAPVDAEELVSSYRERCILTPDKVTAVQEMAELGAKDKDIYNYIGLSEGVFYKYLRQAGIVEQFLIARNVEVTDYDIIPDTIQIIDQNNTKYNIKDCILKLKMKRALVFGRADGSRHDLRTIKRHSKSDWKAAAYRLEKRNPEYKAIPESSTVVHNEIKVDGNSFLNGIMEMATIIEQQNKQLGNDTINVIPSKRVLTKADKFVP